MDVLSDQEGSTNAGTCSYCNRENVSVRRDYSHGLGQSVVVLICPACRIKRAAVIKSLSQGRKDS